MVVTRQFGINPWCAIDRHSVGSLGLTKGQNRKSTNRPCHLSPWPWCKEQRRRPRHPLERIGAAKTRACHQALVTRKQLEIH